MNIKSFALIGVALVGSCECVKACDYGTDQPIFSFEQQPVQRYVVRQYVQQECLPEPVRERVIERVVEPDCYSPQRDCYRGRDEFDFGPRVEHYDRGRSSLSRGRDRDSFSFDSRGRGRDDFSFDERGGFSFERDRRSFSDGGRGGRERGGLLGGGLLGGRGGGGTRFEQDRVFVDAR